MKPIQAFVLSVALTLATASVNAAAAAPADPPLPTLIEPGQTQSTAVYAARRAALMKAMGDAVAVIYAEGADDSAGYRQSSDFLYLTGVQERGAILVLAPKGEDELVVTDTGALPDRRPAAQARRHRTLDGGARCATRQIG